MACLEGTSQGTLQCNSIFIMYLSVIIRRRKYIEKQPDIALLKFMHNRCRCKCDGLLIHISRRMVLRMCSSTSSSSMRSGVHCARDHEIIDLRLDVGCSDRCFVVSGEYSGCFTTNVIVIFWCFLRFCTVYSTCAKPKVAQVLQSFSVSVKATVLLCLFDKEPIFGLYNVEIGATSQKRLSIVV